MTSARARDTVIAATVAAALFVPGRASPHGGKLQLMLAPTGPYVVSVWTRPDPPRVGAVELSAAVLAAESREAVTNVDIRVIARHETTSQVVTSSLARDSGGLLEFLGPALAHGMLTLPVEGRWQVTVSVFGPAGQGSTDFGLAVAPPPQVPWGPVTVGAAIAILAVGAWRWRGAREKARRHVGKPRPSTVERRRPEGRV